MLRKNKIAGVSFHHRSSRKSIKHKYRLQDFFNLDELYLQIKKESPLSFTNADIKRLLADRGRNEINSQISMCIDASTKWVGILRVMERCFPNKYFLNAEYLMQVSEDSRQMSALEDEIEIYLLVKKLIWGWKHNLSILEMTAAAQYFIR